MHWLSLVINHKDIRVFINFRFSLSPDVFGWLHLLMPDPVAELDLRIAGYKLTNISKYQN